MRHEEWSITWGAGVLIVLGLALVAGTIGALVAPPPALAPVLGPPPCPTALATPTWGSPEDWVAVEATREAHVERLDAIYGDGALERAWRGER